MKALFPKVEKLLHLITGSNDIKVSKVIMVIYPEGKDNFRVSYQINSVNQILSGVF